MDHHSTTRKFLIFAVLILVAIAAGTFVRFLSEKITSVPEGRIAFEGPFADTFEVVTPEEWQGGANLPEDVLPPGDAIARVRKIPGYENETIFSAEAVYGSGGEIWYWGVKTSKGVVTVKAQKK